MRWMDRDGKLFGIINILDIFLILLFVGALIFAAIKYVQPEEAEVKTQRQQEVTYVLQNQNEHQFVVERIKEGQTITDERTNIKLGEIIHIKREDSQIYVPTADGRMVITTVPEKEKVLLTIKTVAHVGESASIGGNIPLLVGHKVTIKGPDYRLETVISHVQLEKTS